MNDQQIDIEEPLIRLDQYVAKCLPELSRASAAKLVSQGKVSVNGKLTSKPSYKVKPDDAIKIDYDHNIAQTIPEISIPIIYEDDDCIVIQKPLGLLTHSKGAFNPEATVATWLKKYTIGFEGDRGGIVHRLDRATSGVMICAKTPRALGMLQKQFSQRKAKKIYIALVEGTLKPSHAIIDMPIERNPKAPATFRVGANGKIATTEYYALKENHNKSLVELKPTTGRTHQLRVHLAERGHPIIGDVIYSGRLADRLFLHAKTLEITLPNRERKVFESQLPEAFEQELRK